MLNWARDWLPKLETAPLALGPLAKMKNEFGIHAAGEQLRFLGKELALLTDHKAVRWLVLFLEPPAGVIISYRLDRAGYLLLGRPWIFMRQLAFPLFLLLRAMSCRHEICFKAAIGCGLRVLHPTLGVAVHGEAIVGMNCLLNGGNSIGCRKPMKRGELVLGDDVELGINACVLGPVRVGNHVRIGAGAVVIHDLQDAATAVGVPARYTIK